MLFPCYMHTRTSRLVTWRRIASGACRDFESITTGLQYEELARLFSEENPVVQNVLFPPHSMQATLLLECHSVTTLAAFSEVVQQRFYPVWLVSIRFGTTIRHSDNVLNLFRTSGTVRPSTISTCGSED